MPPAKRPRSASLQSIAPRDYFPPPTSAAQQLSESTVNVPRTRLPPRSRFGCWTCRTRKVKCDEARPECTPCARLGHLCDYNPRLSFKDDTPRVIRKISGRHGGQGPVWKPRSRFSNPNRAHDRYSDRSGRGSSWASNEAVDILGPFHTLTSDVDRERKALTRPPGTFNVVVNPTSFANFNEYKETFPGDPFPPVIATYGGPPANSADTALRGARQTSPLASYNSLDNANDGVEDEDVVILKMFEDNDPDSSISGNLKHQPNSYSAIYSDTTTTSTSASMAHSIPNALSSGISAQRGDIYNYSVDNTPLLRYAHPDGRDHSIIYYYKNFVHRHLAQVHRDTLGTSVETGALTAPDVLERHAGTFLPLYHALMAFSALSMSHKHGMPSLEALQHYQQALPLLQASLHTEDDLASDGVFLTHFILLLYEIAAGEVRGFSYWAHHIDQLLKITLLRRRLYGTEPYNFVVWWVANIDTHVVLTGMGGGQYIESVLRLKLLPTGLGSDLQHMPSSSSLWIEEPTHALPSSLAFHRRICFLAAELSILTRDIRDEAKKIAPEQPNADTIDHWQRRIAKIQDNLRRTWNVQMPESHVRGADDHQLLPVGARGIFEHTYAMYRALLIYSHTSMYSSQMRYHKSYAIHEVSQSASEILQLGREIVNSGHMERKFIVFPLFMAGFAEKRPAERTETLNLLRKLEQDSIGRNFIATRHLLEMVYDRQNLNESGLNLGAGRPADARRRSAGDYQVAYDHDWPQWKKDEPADVDWVGMIGEMGLQVVSYDGDDMIIGGDMFDDTKYDEIDDVDDDDDD